MDLGIDMLRNETETRNGDCLVHEESGGNEMLQDRTHPFQKTTAYPRLYFFIFRHKLALSMPRISAVRTRMPPVSLRICWM